MASKSDPNRRDLIVEVALQRMTTLGFEGTTVGDIANDLGISKAAVGYYFRRKDDFLTEFAEPVLAKLESVIEQAAEAEDALRSYLDVLIEHHERAKWIDTDPAVQGHAEFGPRLSNIRDGMVDLITGGSAERSDQVRALGVLGGIWRPIRELPFDVIDSEREAIVSAALAGYVVR